MCVIAEARAPIGLGGVMGGESTGRSEATTDVFIESAWFDPIRTAQTGRDARHRLRRPVPLRPRRGYRLRACPGLELATPLILELCGGEPSESWVGGAAPAPPPPMPFDPAM